MLLAAASALIMMGWRSLLTRPAGEPDALLPSQKRRSRSARVQMSAGTHAGACGSTRAHGSREEQLDARDSRALPPLPRRALVLLSHRLHRSGHIAAEQGSRRPRRHVAIALAPSQTLVRHSDAGRSRIFPTSLRGSG